jgi:acetyl esterase/lipase
VDSPTPTGALAWRRLALHALLLAALVGGVVAAPVAPAGRDAPAAAARERPAANGGIRLVRELRYAFPARAVVDVYAPRWRRQRLLPAVLVVHGGGWRAGDKRRMAWLSRQLAAAGFVAFNANYTLAAAGRPGFPRQVHELRAAVRWMRRNARALGIDPARIGAVGSSAGAHLVSLLGLGDDGPLSAGARVGAVVTWSAPFDLGRTDDRILAPAIDTLLGCGLDPCSERRAAASPISHVSRDDPPMLIFNSQSELVPLAHAEGMAARLASAGVPYALTVLSGSGHGRDYAATALAPTVAFLRRRLG